MSRDDHDDDDRPKVLVIDDDQEIVGAIRSALKFNGYVVVTAADGKAGLHAIRKEDPDLIIVDMMMPKKSGYLVIEEMPSEDPPPVIMITANEGQRHQAYAEMLGVKAYLRKPFAMEKLLETVQKLLPVGQDD